MTNGVPDSDQRGFKDRMEVFEGVKEVLCEVLKVEENDVFFSARLFADLGTDSVGYMEIMVMLEDVFGITIPVEDVVPNLSLSKSGLVRDGIVTPAGIIEIRRIVPYADFTLFERDPRIERIDDIFTVKFLADYVVDRLGLQT